MSILTIKNLTKVYGKGKTAVRALDDVSFSVEPGEFVAIVGASGSGKSTLLHLIGGVDTKTEGQIIVNGQNISKFTPDQLAIYRRRQVGIVYQFYNLLPTLTVTENITVPVQLDKKSVDKTHLSELLKVLKLERRKDNLPNQLSGGEQQRTSIGRALINRPALLLADEPTGNLDSKNSDEIVALLQNYNQNYHQTIILITHNPAIAALATRVITMADGKIVTDVQNPISTPQASSPLSSTTKSQISQD